MVARDGEASTEALAATFGVSRETIRRDLFALASTGALQRLKGGARRLRLHAEGSFRERMAEHAAAKAEIARRLPGLIAPGDTLFLDTGTTTLACADALRQIDRLTVITNSLGIARTLSGDGRRVFLLGGLHMPGNDQTVGPLAIEQIGRFQADHAVLTVAALDAAGAMDADFDEAQIARAMIAHARNVIVVAPSAKFGRRAAFAVCRLDEIDVLVSEREPDAPLAAALAVAKVEVR